MRAWMPPPSAPPRSARIRWNARAGGTVVSDVRRRCDAMECTWLHLDSAPAPGRDGLPARTGVQDPHVTDLLRRLQADALAGMPLGTACVQPSRSRRRAICADAAGTAPATNVRQRPPAARGCSGRGSACGSTSASTSGSPFPWPRWPARPATARTISPGCFGKLSRSRRLGPTPGEFRAGRACNARAAPLAGDARSRRRPRFRQRWLSRRTAQSPRLCTACTKKISTTTTASMMSGRNRW
ncbi:hypothetical protein SAMN04489708_113145 [Paracidovorax cattleyae]|uniref:Uncharacterized protein n=1 Tax=Paracidovorax cattleyae TaxID=80868 RepID=A0A1H0SZB0_9BURK|nr:hypothetical protein SAMN04489708_113145 [Paracidovorax cattleyae]